MAASIAIREESHAAIDYIHSRLGRVVGYFLSHGAYLERSEEIRSHENPLDLSYVDYYWSGEINGLHTEFFGVQGERVLEQLKTIGESPYVEYYSYSFRQSPDLEPTRADYLHEEDVFTQLRPLLVGVHRVPMIELEHSNAIISLGREFSQKELENSAQVCIVSKEFSELNHLKPGDTIPGIVTPQHIEPSLTHFDLNLEIVGIIDYQKVFAPVHELLETSIEESTAHTNLYNEVIIPNELVRNLQLQIYSIQLEEPYPETYPPQEHPKVLDRFIVMKDPSEIASFKEEKEHLLKDGDEFFDNRYRYEILATP